MWFRLGHYCALWKWEEREIAGDCIPEKEAGGVWGNMCVCVAMAGEVQGWYHRPLERSSNNVSTAWLKQLLLPEQGSGHLSHGDDV